MKIYMENTCSGCYSDFLKWEYKFGVPGNYESPPRNNLGAPHPVQVVLTMQHAEVFSLIVLISQAITLLLSIKALQWRSTECSQPVTFGNKLKKATVLLQSLLCGGDPFFLCQQDVVGDILFKGPQNWNTRANTLVPEGL